MLTAEKLQAQREDNHPFRNRHWRCLRGIWDPGDFVNEIERLAFWPFARLREDLMTIELNVQKGLAQ
jgi:hypothetical protein